MVLDEEKAMYYRYLHNYKTVVLHEVKELQDLNGQMIEAGGPDHLPLLKYLTDSQIYKIPHLAPLMKAKHAQEQVAPGPPRAKPPQQEAKLANKIRLNIQKAFSIDNAAVHER